MARNIKRIGIWSVGLGLVAVLGFTAGAFAGGPFGHGAAMHWALGQIVDELGLDAEQQARLDHVHEIISTRLEQAHANHENRHAWLRQQVTDGEVDPVQVREAIDQHLESTRATAYEVADELVAFVNSLDEEQRATLVDELDSLHQSLAEGCGTKISHFGAHHSSH